MSSISLMRVALCYLSCQEMHSLSMFFFTARPQLDQSSGVSKRGLDTQRASAAAPRRCRPMFVSIQTYSCPGAGASVLHHRLLRYSFRACERGDDAFPNFRAHTLFPTGGLHCASKALHSTVGQVRLDLSMQAACDCLHRHNSCQVHERLA